MKRPSFQFYPGDWLQDAPLRSCSIGARGLWADMLCLMHQGSPYGYLKVGGKVILPANLARMCGVTPEEAEGYLEELETAEVFSRDAEGCIFSRRMVRDEKIRESRAAGGIKGGNPALMKRREGSDKVNLAANLPPTPSSSSSSSSSTPIPPAAAAAPSPGRRKRKDNLPDSDTAKRVGAMFHRRPDTPWSEKELRALDHLGPVNLDDLGIVENRYAAQWPPNGENCLRTSLLTFLNNFPGEVDRARAFEHAQNRGRPGGKGSVEPPRGEFARPFSLGPQKPQHVIDRENAARAAHESNPHLTAA